MTSGNRVRTALVAAVMAAGAAGCAEKAAGGGDLLVDALPLEAPVVLDPVPDGLLLTNIQYEDPGGEYAPQSATLYGDPALADTLDGPVLLLGSSEGSAYSTGPNHETGGREVDRGGRTGRVVPDGDRTWVLIEGNEYVEFVVGRGIDEEDLVEAARGADFGSTPRTIASDAVPSGLEPLVAGGPPDGPGAAGLGEQLHLEGELGSVSVFAVRADPRLAALWGFWTGDTTGTSVRGRPGWAGSLAGSYLGGAEGQVWAEDGLVLAVVGRDASPDLLDQAVQAVRVGTWAEFEAFRRQIIDSPLRPDEAGCRPGWGFVGGSENGVRWAFAVERDRSDPETWSTCSTRFRAPSDEGGTTGVGTFEVSGGGAITLPPVGKLGGVPASPAPGTPSAAALFGIVGGIAPPGSTRVTVAAADGRTLDAVLADVGPRPGERVWGALVPQQDPPWADALPFTVTAYDAAGAVLDSKTG